MDATGLGACLQHRLIAGIRPHLGIKNIEYLVTNCSRLQQGFASQ